MKIHGVLAVMSCVLAWSFLGCTRSEKADESAARRGQPGAPSASLDQATLSPLVGSAWIAEAIADRDIIDNSQLTIRFDSVGRVSGSTGLNNFTGSATVSGQSLTFGPMASTRRAGPEALMDQEQRFLAALGSTATWKTDEHGRLLLQGAAGATLLRCSPMPAGAPDKSGSAASEK